ncbi:MAG TPA: hypothetical protein VMV19_18180 [Xanthobacteraceae bacterium]|nr:hypothetical protein [Xanthobacteraceae bacterium]
MMRDAEAARVRAQAAELKIVPASELIDYTPHQAGRASTVDEHIFNSPHQTGRRS